MPSKERMTRKRKQEWYLENASAIKKRKTEETSIHSTKKSSTFKAWYLKRAKGEKSKARKRYQANIETERLRKNEQYSANPEPHKARMRQKYSTDPEHYKAKNRLNYHAKQEMEQSNRRRRYKVLRAKHPGHFRSLYKRNVFHERVRKCAAYQRRRFVLKNNSDKKRKPVKNSKRKTKKNVAASHIFLGKINSEKIARLIAKKIPEQGYTKRLLRAKELLKWVLHAYKNYKNNFLKLFVGLQNRAKESLAKLSATSTFEYNVEALCGRSLHVSTSEPYFWEFTYRVFSGKPITVGNEPSTAHIFPSFTSTLSDKKISSPRKKWKCNSDICFIEPDHLEQLKSLYNEIVTSSLTKGSKLIVSMGEHSCQSGVSYRVGVHPHSLDCYSGACVSKLIFLRTISPHFPAIRRLVFQIYRLLKIAKKIMLIKNGILNMQVSVLFSIEREFKEQTKAFLTDDTSESKVPDSESQLFKKYHKAFEALEKRSSETPVFPCVSCDKLFSKRQVSVLKNMKNPIVGHIWQRIKNIKKEECKTGWICRGCLEKLRKGQMPPTCILNDLQVCAQPKELTCLNSYEKVLIQRAKAFQVVTKMYTVGKKTIQAQQRVSKVVGRSFHLPLPLQETLQKLPRRSDPLNPNHELYVLVRGVPTKAKKVWQMLVSVDKVHAALRFLQKNNPHYGSIELPTDPEGLFNLNDDTNVFQSTHQNELPPQGILHRRAILTQVTHEEWESEESHYTIHALHESKSYSDDTELYKMLKVNEPPISHENKEIDVLCFPDLYPEGKFGQFHSRETKLTSAEFIKCRLLSKHSQFRLNQQYLFYLLHDANLRQLRQGVFHKLNVTGFSGSLCARDCLNNLASGELEGNLTSVFSKLRNTSQYWIQPRNDVNCMAQHYGPATWFLTISPSDWNWDDMALFIREVNRSVLGVEKKTN